MSNRRVTLLYSLVPLRSLRLCAFARLVRERVSGNLFPPAIDTRRAAAGMDAHRIFGSSRAKRGDPVRSTGIQSGL
jgi:hypothetical protein